MIEKLIDALNKTFLSYNNLLKNFEIYDRVLIEDFIDEYGDTFQIKGWKSKTSKAEGIFTIDPLFLATDKAKFILALEARKWQLKDIINIVPSDYKSSNSNIVGATGAKINDKKFISRITEFKEANKQFFLLLDDLASSIAFVSLNIEALPDVVTFDEALLNVQTNDIFITSIIKSVIGRLSNKLRFAKPEEIVDFLYLSSKYKTQLSDLCAQASTFSIQQFKNRIYNIIMDARDDLVEQDIHISRNIVDDVISLLLKPQKLISLNLKNYDGVLKKTKHIISSLNLTISDITLTSTGLAAELEFLELVVRQLDFKYPTAAFYTLFKEFILRFPNSSFLSHPAFIAVWLIINNRSIPLDIIEASLSTLLMIIKKLLNEIIDEVGNKIGKIFSPF